jgi:hypothetical protein
VGCAAGRGDADLGGGGELLVGKKEEGRLPKAVGGKDGMPRLGRGKKPGIVLHCSLEAMLKPLSVLIMAV